MQDSDRQMLMEYWLFQLMKGGHRPLCYARAADDNKPALVAFLLPVDEHLINEAECEVVLDPGPPCQVRFRFQTKEQEIQLVVPVDEQSNCPAQELLNAARQADTFWLFISSEDSQAVSLYEIGWNPSS